MASEITVRIVSVAAFVCLSIIAIVITVALYLSDANRRDNCAEWAKEVKTVSSDDVRRCMNGD